MNILLTSVGRRGYLVEYFKDALNGSGKVHVSNSDSISPAFKYADEHVVTPLIYDKEYINFLLEYCIKNRIKLVISLFDIDLYVLAVNKRRFEEKGIIIVVSDADFIKICNDKWLTYKYLINNNISTPQTFLSVEKAVRKIEKGELKYPLIVKPRWGMGSLEIYTADNKDELLLFYEKIKRNIKKSYLKYESDQDINNSVIIQEKIIGQEFGADIINNLKGEYENSIIRKKIAMRAGETDIAEIIENEIIKEITKRIAICSKHIGNLDVDILYDGSMYYVLEMNARFGGGYPFSHLSGVNLPLAIINWTQDIEFDNEILQAIPGIKGQKDIRIINYD